MSDRALVFIPTYNEKENVGKICSEIIALGIDLDILFMDDNSPDGTGAVIDELAKKHKNVMALHRPGKMGVGSAHLDGIEFAYDKGYKNIITMDCDFAHSPAILPDLIKISKDYDIVVGSRYIMNNSIEGWSLFRKFMTLTGHFLTKHCLGIKYDATGALRFYKLDRIPKDAFKLVRSRGYSFFFESLYILSVNNFSIKELPIIIPPRMYGHSKMNLREILHSVNHLVRIYLGVSFNRKFFTINKSAVAKKDADNGWDWYWESKNDAGGLLYDMVAAFYRKVIIRPGLNHFVKRYFKEGSKLLHAGCGSGQTDAGILRMFPVTALDNSFPALNIYRRFNSAKGETVNGDIHRMPFRESSYDGIYNLGVMEHFTEEDIAKILSEFRRILKPEGKVVIFWPPVFGISVIFLNWLRAFMKKVFGKEIRLHPDEIMLARSKEQLCSIFKKADFRVIECYFGIMDFFTHVVVVAEKDKLCS
ncbi:MAG: glycosyltransferase [Candidatus Omnitrophica bacterium]|nr:glycosyltransferase [Candidatus Omnitrophota bacterium]